jgi:membrane dipeptidase
MTERGRKILRAIIPVVLVLLVAGIVVLAILPQIVDRMINTVLTPGPYTASAPATELHKKLFVADLHSDSLLWDRDLLERNSVGHVDIPRLRDGNVALQAFTIVTKVPKGQNYENNAGDTDSIKTLVMAERWPVATWNSLKERALYQAGKLHQLAARSQGKFVVIESVPDLEKFVAARKTDSTLVAGFLGIEGAHCLEGDIKNLDVVAKAGVRMIGLTHFFDNELGGSAHGVSKGGLTEFGKLCVKRMEELNILIDLAHTSPKIIDDVLAIATRPVVVSHTGVKGTCDRTRNLSDDHVKKIGELGGVVGIGYWDEAICDTTPAGVAKAIKHAVTIAGVDHVGLGSDFDGATSMPFDTTGLVLITDALQKEGFSDEDIAKIMGGNTLELMRKSLPAS